MKTADEMTIELQIAFEELKAGTIKHKDLDALSNSVGKMIGMAKAQLEYDVLRKQSPKRPFLEAPPEISLS